MRTILFISLFFILPHITDAAVIGGGATNSLTNGLVAYYTFDGKDITNGRLNDVTGRGNHGYFANIATTTFFKQGKIGQAGNFDGVNDYVNIPGTGLNFERTQPFSVSMWVNTRGTYSAGNAQSLFGRWGDGGAGNTQFWGICGFTQANVCNTNSIAFVGIGNSGTRTLTAYAALNAYSPYFGKWTHVVMTYDGSSTGAGIFMYINGASLALTKYTGTPMDATWIPSVDWRIGDDHTNDYVPGSIDEVRVYNRVLSATDVMNLYNESASKMATAPAQSLTNGLVGYWTFDGKDVVNGVAKDLSGQNINGYLNNISTSTFYAQGKVGQGFTFDGLNDNVDVSGLVSKIATGNASVSLWIKPAGFPFCTKVGGCLFFALADNPSTNDFKIGSAENGKLALVAYPNTLLAGSATVWAPRWYHVAGTFSTTAGTKLYLDNVLVASNASQTTRGTTQSVFAHIGGQPGTFIASSTIDEVRVYNREISANEVSQLYSQGGGKLGTSPVQGLTNGLVGYWNFDGKNMTNGRMNDMSGRGNHANFANIATTTFFKQGKIGQGGNFDGVNDYVVVPRTNLDFERTDPFSVSMWVNVRDTYAAGGGQTFFGRYSAGSNYQTFLVCGSALPTQCSAKSLAFLAVSNSTNDAHVSTATNSFVPYFGKWTYITMTYDGSSTAGGMKLYINGVSQSLTLHSNETLTGTWKPSPAVDWRIGDDYTSDYVPGGIDDVRVYNRALSATDVMNLYNMGR